MRRPWCPTCRGDSLYSSEGVGSEPRPKESHEACPNEEIDWLYFFEAHRDGVIVAHILSLGAVHQASDGLVCRSV